MHIGAVELFIADQKFTKAVKPAVCDFDNPAPCALARLALEFLRFLPAPLDVRDVAALFNDLTSWLAHVGGIGARVLGAGARDFAAVEHGLELRDVMPVGPCHDERERDATPVDKQVPLAPIFFPDPWDWLRRIPGLKAPSSWPHQCFATPTRGVVA